MIDNNKPVQVVTLIRTAIETRGDGTKTPIRIIEQYWDMEGNFVFEIDPHLVNQRNLEAMDRRGLLCNPDMMCDKCRELFKDGPQF